MGLITETFNLGLTVAGVRVRDCHGMEHGSMQAGMAVGQSLRALILIYK